MESWRERERRVCSEAWRGGLEDMSDVDWWRWARERRWWDFTWIRGMNVDGRVERNEDGDEVKCVREDVYRFADCFSLV